MTIVGTAYVEIRPDTKGFGDNAERGVLGSVTSIAKKATAILGGAFAAREVFQFGKTLFNAAEESLKIARQTEAVVKSTGGAAGVTADQVGRLVDKLSAKNVVDDEAIQQGANLLLTFTNVRNEVGKGNDIFDQANQTLLDMAAALGGDVSSNAIQLGKALNDPVAGLTALTRVGVSFTEQQKDQIKAMVAAGNTAGAQRLILAELNKEFGGSAAAQATAADRLRIVWGNVQEDLGARLLPIVEKVGTFLADNLPRAVDVTTRAVGALSRFLQPVVAGVQDFFRALQSEGTEGETGIEKFAFLIRDQVLPVVARVADFVRDNLKPILIGAAVAFGLFTAPITSVVLALGFLYARFGVVRDVVGTVVGFVVNAIGRLIAFFQEIAPQVQEALGHVLAVVQVVLGFIMDAWDLFGDDILRIVGAVFDQVRNAIEFAINTIMNVIRLVLAVINGDWGKAWDALKAIVTGAFDFVLNTIKNVGDLLVGALGLVWDLITKAAGAAWDGFTGLARAAFDGIVDFVTGLPGRLGRLAGSLVDAALSLGKALIEGIGKGISGAFNFVGELGVQVVNGIIGFINRNVIDKINDALEFRIEVFGQGIDINAPDLPHLPRLAGGGILRSRPGGVAFVGAEAGRDEAVIPLPAGLLDGLQRLAGVTGGAQVTGPLLSMQVTVEAGVDATRVEAAMRKVAREEITPALNGLALRVNAGAGTR